MVRPLSFCVLSFPISIRPNSYLFQQITILMEDDFQGAEQRDSGDSTALYGSWYGTLRVVVRHTTDGKALSYYFFRTQRHGDTEESILSVLIRAIRALKIG